MRYLKAWLLGSVAATILGGAAAAVLSAVAASGAVGGVRLAAGALVLIEVRGVDGGMETTVGAGLPVLAALGGTVNALVLALLLRRDREEDPIA